MKNIFAKYAPTALIISILLLLYVSFEREIIENFDRFIIPIFSIMRFNIITKILFCIIISIFLFSFFRFKWYKGNEKVYWFSFVIILIYGYYCWYEKLYTPILIFGFVGYTDILISVLIFILLCKVVFAFMRKSKVKKFLHRIIQIFKKQKVEEKKNIADIISDEPIHHPDDDILDYSKNVELLIQQIKSFPDDKPCSIGVVSNWGGGKTSYLNLLKYYLLRNEDNFIVVDFNPRYSYRVEDIQKDFFSELFSVLKKYDSRFSKSFKDYLKALNIIDNKFFSLFLEFYNIWDKGIEKDKINMAIKQLGKRVIIIIEDLDRLLADEIIEIFKLIDENAAFTNMVFITAYDKKHINKVIGKKYSNEKSSFSDKFFTIEEYIPLRPYDVYINYLQEEFRKSNLSENEKEEIVEIIRQYDYILYEFLPTIRDLKRFFNVFLRLFRQIRKEVECRDYFLLQIIKYFDLKTYEKLYSGKYVYTNSYSQIKLKNKFKDDKTGKIKIKSKTKKIIKELFPEDGKRTNRSINNSARIFNIYFHNILHNVQSNEQIERSFSIETMDKVIEFINSMFRNRNNELILHDLISYLETRNIFVFEYKRHLERYIDILIYLYSLKKDIRIFVLIFNLILKDTTEQIKKDYDCTEEEYKEFLSNKLEGSYPYYPNITGEMLREALKNKDLKDKLIFTKEELLDISKKALDNLLANDDQVKQLHLELLYSCFSELENNTRKLDKDSCKKVYEAIKKEPEYFLNDFVTPLVDGVRAPLFWEDLFKNKEELKELINRTNFENKILVKNFWELLENNGYKSIEILDKPFDQMVSDNLEREIKKLRLLENIEDEFKEVKSKQKEEISNTNYLERFIRLSEKVIGVKLNILRKIELDKEIEKSISECEKEMGKLQETN